MSESSAAVDPARWVTAHGDSLFAYAMSRLHDKETAEEVVQEAFLAALRNISQYRSSGSEGAWLMGILKRKVIDQLRQSAKQPLTLDAEDSVVAGLFDDNGNWSAAAQTSNVFSLDAIEREEFRQIFAKCLEGLPDNQSAVFVLREVQQQTGEEVCKVLGISASNLWVLMHRARIRLSECIKSRWAMGDA